MNQRALESGDRKMETKSNTQKREEVFFFLSFFAYKIKTNDKQRELVQT